MKHSQQLSFLFSTIALCPREVICYSNTPLKMMGLTQRSTTSLPLHLLLSSQPQAHISFFIGTYQSGTHRTHPRSGLVDGDATAVGSRTASVYPSPDVLGKPERIVSLGPTHLTALTTAAVISAKKSLPTPWIQFLLLYLELPNEGFTTAADTLLRICCSTNYVSRLWSMIPLAIRSRDPTEGGRTCLFFFRAPCNSQLVS